MVSPLNIPPAAVAPSSSPSLGLYDPPNTTQTLPSPSTATTAEVSVEHLLLVIVTLLQHAIALAKRHVAETRLQSSVPGRVKPAWRYAELRVLAGPRRNGSAPGDPRGVQAPSAGARRGTAPRARPRTPRESSGSVTHTQSAPSHVSPTNPPPPRRERSPAPLTVVGKKMRRIAVVSGCPDNRVIAWWARRGETRR